MRIPRHIGRTLTPHQAISYFMIKECDTDYIEYLDYDYADWIEWGWINRN